LEARYVQEKADLQSRIRHLEHANTLAQAQTQQEREEYKQNLAHKQAEIDRARQAEKKAMSQSNDWPHQLQLLKDSLSDLNISESMYMEYSAIAKDRQSVREFVCVRVYDMMAVERGNREAVTVECQQVREQLVRAESEMERVRMEREQMIRSKRA
jgi:hypothetical protein